MPFRDRDHDFNEHYLRRITDALESIALTLAADLEPPPTSPPATGVSLMSFPTGPVSPGATDTGTGTAFDAAGNAVAAATVAIVSSDPTIVSLSADSSVDGVDTVTWTAVAAGTASISGVATNVDGSVTSGGTNNPVVITVSAPTDLATTVTLA
jgi:hypothetical protein